MHRRALTFILLIWLAACAQGKTLSAGAVAGAQDSGSAAGVAVSGLHGLVLSSGQSEVAIGSKLQLQLTATYRNGSSKEVSSFATWSSAEPLVATVASNGVVSGVKTGEVQITATLGGQEAHATIKVTGATVQQLIITPRLKQLATGLDAQFAAIAYYTDGSAVDVTADAEFTSSSADSLAAVKGQPGAFSALKPAAVIVSASYGGQVATVNLTVVEAQLVGLTLLPSSLLLPLGQSQSLTVSGTYTDGKVVDLSSMATWLSSASSIASVAAGGSVTATGAGVSSITARIGGVSATAAVGVSSAVLSGLAINNPTVGPMPAGRDVVLSATGTFSDQTQRLLTTGVSWSSANLAVASIEPGTGVLHPLSVGSVQITALASGVSTVLTVTVSAPVLVSFTAFDVAGMANVSPITMIKGTTKNIVIKATDSAGSVLDVTAMVTVVPVAGVVTATPVNIGPGDDEITLAATLTGSSLLRVTYTPSGFVGTIPITVTSAVITSIALTPILRTGEGSLPSPYQEPVGRQRQMRATATYSDSTTAVLSNTLGLWSADAASMYTSPPVYVSTSTTPGQVTALAVGVATVSYNVAGVIGSFTYTVIPKVMDSVAVSPLTAVSLTKGQSTSFTATATYSDSSLYGYTTDLTSSRTQAGVVYTVTWAVTTQGGVDAVQGTVASNDGAFLSTHEGLATVSATVTSTTYGTRTSALAASGLVAVSTPNCATITGSRVANGSYSFNGVAHDNTYCWYLGAQNQSCTALCAANPFNTMVHAATTSFAGSGASNSSNCTGILTALQVLPIASPAQSNANTTSSLPLGCAVNHAFGAVAPNWYQSPATTNGGTDPNVARVCACTTP